MDEEEEEKLPSWFKFNPAILSRAVEADKITTETCGALLKAIVKYFVHHNAETLDSIENDLYSAFPFAYIYFESVVPMIDDGYTAYQKKVEAGKNSRKKVTEDC